MGEIVFEAIFGDFPYSGIIKQKYWKTGLNNEFDTLVAIRAKGTVKKE